MPVLAFWRRKAKATDYCKYADLPMGFYVVGSGGGDHQLPPSMKKAPLARVRYRQRDLDFPSNWRSLCWIAVVVGCKPCARDIV